MAYRLDTKKYVSPNYDNRPSGMAIDSIVIHTTEGWFPSDAQWLCDPTSKVSTHYVVPPTGEVVYQLVGDSKRAWHAGESSYHGRADFNDFSIGVEISHLNDQPWPAGQQSMLGALCRYLIDHHPIAQANIVAHRWIATPYGRKSDPTDWPDAEFKQWIASLYAPLTAVYAVVSPCAIFTARDPSAPLAGGPNEGQTWLAPGTMITVGDVQSGWLWISPNTVDPCGIGFIPQSYARPI